MIRSWFGLWCHTNGVGDGGFKGGMKGPLSRPTVCAHQLEGCTVWPFSTTHTLTLTHSIHLVGTQKLYVSIGTIMIRSGALAPRGRLVSRIFLESAPEMRHALAIAMLPLSGAAGTKFPYEQVCSPSLGTLAPRSSSWLSLLPPSSADGDVQALTHEQGRGC